MFEANRFSHWMSHEHGNEQHLKSLTFNNFALWQISCDIYFETGYNQGAWGDSSPPPPLEKVAKISHNRTENRPQVRHNFCEQLMFYQYAYGLQYLFDSKFNARSNATYLNDALHQIFLRNGIFAANHLFQYTRQNILSIE